MKAYSGDLRRRIIEAIQDNEETQPEIAERLSVGLSFVEKLWRRFRETNSYEALPHSGGRERLLKNDESLIRRKVAEQPRAAASCVYGVNSRYLKNETNF